MSPEEITKHNQLLWKFRDDLWGLLKAEAKKQNRTVPRHLETILEERYDVSNLSPDVIREAVRLANEGKAERAAKRPRKGSKKTVNGR